MSRWQIREPLPLPENWAKQLSISPLFLQILLGRHIGNFEEINSYLAARKKDLVPPRNWPLIPEAANILFEGLSKGKKIAVWGDYDVDGITATAVALDILEEHGIEAGYHLPDRKNEGYGLNIAGIEELAREGYEVLLTVDCGISDCSAISRANELGMTVVVSDHHLPGKALPPAKAICDPKIGNMDTWPCPHLSGVGVSFYLMAAVNQLLSGITGKKYKMDRALDLAALGTLADVVPLEGQNRILTRAGLTQMASNPRPGIAALKTICDINAAAAISETEVIFRLAPRINAAGRMSHANLALQLLRAKDHFEAANFAAQLEECNKARKLEEDRIYHAARQQALNLLEKKDYSSLVLYGSDWHAGIVGIVASRIVDEFYRPAIVLCDDDGLIKGSGRSIEGFDLYNALDNVSHCLTGFGGHRLAAGLRLDAKYLEEFREEFDKEAFNSLGEKPPQPLLLLDCELDFSQASNHEFLQEMELMQPFGPGNEEPLFVSPPLKVVSRSFIGRTRDHVRLQLKDLKSGYTLYAKAWRMASSFPAEIVDKTIKLAYTPRFDFYNGNVNIDISIKDWKIWREGYE